jgi:predicted lysophospholipase L1 biosynthesis ABC-type transport system permease subunit
LSDNVSERGLSPENEKVETAVDALLKILAANRIERWTYLGISVVSFAVLLLIVVIELLNKTIDIAVFIGMFASTGVVGVCVARVLEVWKDCIKLLTAILVGDIKK